MLRRTVFISYSRKDSVQVEKAVDLLEAGGADVFRDLDDIQYGDRWEDVIRKQLADAERVLVFWSLNAQLSEWVQREWSIAINMQKRVVPILLDQTPLPTELQQFHALTNFVSTPAATNPPQKLLKTLPWLLIALTGIGLVVWMSASTLDLKQSKPDTFTQSPQTEDSTGQLGMGGDSSTVHTAPDLPTETYPQVPKPAAPSAKPEAPEPSIQSDTTETSAYLVGLSGFLLLSAIFSYLWLRRRRQVQHAASGEQLVKDIFQE